MWRTELNGLILISVAAFEYPNPNGELSLVYLIPQIVNDIKSGCHCMFIFYVSLKQHSKRLTEINTAFFYYLCIGSFNLRNPSINYCNDHYTIFLYLVSFLKKAQKYYVACLLTVYRCCLVPQILICGYRMCCLCLYFIQVFHL